MRSLTTSYYITQEDFHNDLPHKNNNNKCQLECIAMAHILILSDHAFPTCYAGLVGDKFLKGHCLVQ